MAGGLVSTKYKRPSLVLYTGIKRANRLSIYTRLWNIQWIRYSSNDAVVAMPVLLYDPNLYADFTYIKRRMKREKINETKNVYFINFLMTIDFTREYLVPIVDCDMKSTTQCISAQFYINRHKSKLYIMFDVCPETRKYKNSMYFRIEFNRCPTVQNNLNIHLANPYWCCQI